MDYDTSTTAAISRVVLEQSGAPHAGTAPRPPQRVGGARQTNDERRALCLRIASGWTKRRATVLPEYLYRQLRPVVPRGKG